MFVCVGSFSLIVFFFFFFFNDTATTEIYTLSLHDALPICASPNEMVVHGIPGRFKLRKGDILSVDIGVVKDGWVADGARTFPVGEVSPLAEKLLEVTQRSLFRAVEQCWPGKRLGDVSNAVQSTVEAEGMSVVRSLVGHGIGRSMHEDPQIPNFGEPGRGPMLE